MTDVTTTVQWLSDRELIKAVPLRYAKRVAPGETPREMTDSAGLGSKTIQIEARTSLHDDLLEPDTVFVVGNGAKLVGEALGIGANDGVGSSRTCNDDTGGEHASTGAVGRV